MSGGGESPPSKRPWWVSLLDEELTDLAGADGSILQSPEDHRRSYLQRIEGRSFTAALFDGAPSGRPGPSLVRTGLDTAAGLLVEMPQLEKDSWRGWGDPRLASVVAVLGLVELPERAPRSALESCWVKLRSTVPFELPLGRPGDRPASLAGVTDWIAGYLADLSGQVASWEEVGDHPAPLLASRLRHEIVAHGSRVRERVVPLALALYGSYFPSQRSALGMGEARGLERVLEEGRGLRRVPKLRVHLAVWVLRSAGLPKALVGLALHHFESGVLQTPVPNSPKERPSWRAELAKEIDNSVLYWTGSRGGDQRDPRRLLEAVEFELFDLIRPVGG